jgi:hypothetical protein
VAPNAELVAAVVATYAPPVALVVAPGAELQEEAVAA